MKFPCIAVVLVGVVACASPSSSPPSRPKPVVEPPPPPGDAGTVWVAGDRAWIAIPAKPGVVTRVAFDTTIFGDLGCEEVRPADVVVLPEAATTLTAWLPVGSASLVRVDDGLVERHNLPPIGSCLPLKPVIVPVAEEVVDGRRVVRATLRPGTYCFAEVWSQLIDDAFQTKDGVAGPLACFRLGPVVAAATTAPPPPSPVRDDATLRSFLVGGSDSASRTGRFPPGWTGPLYLVFEVDGRVSVHDYTPMGFFWGTPDIGRWHVSSGVVTLDMGRLGTQRWTVRTDGADLLLGPTRYRWFDGGVDF